jgi:putative ATP-binding cassette transporter
MSNILKDLPWRRLWKVGRPFWVSDQKVSAYINLFTVLALMCGNIFLQVAATYMAGKVARYIQIWDLPKIWLFLGLSAGLVALQAPAQFQLGLLRTRLALRWRKWLSVSLITKWYDPKTKPYYWITTRRKDVANPDQRMTQDPDSFANSTIGLLTAFIEAGVQIVTWAGVLISLSYVLTGAAIFCALVSSTVVLLIGKALIALTNQQMDTEAELRVSAGRAREGAEAIALGSGEEVSRAQAVTRVGKVIDTLLSVMTVNRNIQIFTTSWNLLMPLVPPAVMVYMSPGPIDYEYIVRAAGAFTAFYTAANIFANQFGGLASYFAIVNRLGVFTEAIDWAGEEPQAGKHIDVQIGEDIVLDNVTILALDDSRVLLSGVTFSVGAGESLLVLSSMPEALGKSSLIKTIAGLQNAGSGKMQRPNSEEVMFLTPNPDLPTCTLRQALSYPKVEECMNDAQLIQTLNMVNLGQLAERLGGLDTVQNWRETISKTEQQRLVLGHIVQNKPRYVVIDETGLDEENERLLYTVLAAMGSRVISVGNPATLLRFASKVLEILPSGECKLYPANEYVPPQAPLQNLIDAVPCNCLKVDEQRTITSAFPLKSRNRRPGRS